MDAEIGMRIALDMNEDAEQDGKMNESADDHESHELSLGLAGDVQEHDSSTADH